MRSRSLFAIALFAGMAAVGAAQSGAGREGAQGRPAPLEPHPSTQLPEHKVTAEQLLKWEKELSNWGRWGADDQRGALNLITPQKTKSALLLAKEGVYASIHHFPEVKTTIDNNNMNVEFKHWNTTVDPKTGQPRGALDAITFAIHDGGDTHMDALCHYGVEGSKGPGKTVLGFNGKPQELLPEGCGSYAVDKMGKGYITRGILIDMPLLKGVKWLEPRTPIYVADLEAWEKFAGIKIGSGDVVFVRTGRWAMRNEKGPWNAAREIAGLHASVLPWIKQRDIAVLSGEGVVDAQPSGTPWNRPIHSIAISIMGVPMIDNSYLEDVAAIASRLKRWEFMLSWAAMQVPNGTATPFTALATF